MEFIKSEEIYDYWLILKKDNGCYILTLTTPKQELKWKTRFDTKAQALKEYTAAANKLLLTTLYFIDGTAVIKQGRKKIANIVDREVFYERHNIPGSYNKDLPYMLELCSMKVARECADLNEAKFYLHKYTGILIEQ